MENIICIGSTFWDEPWRRRQQIASRLATTHNVLYLEPPVSIRNHKRFLKSFCVFNVRRRLKKINTNLFVFPTTVPLPFGRLKLCKLINKQFLLFVVKKLQSLLNMPNPILLIWDFWEADMYIGKLDEKIVAFDWYDEWAGFSNANRYAAMVEKKEKEMAMRANIVFTVSNSLFQKAKTMNEDTYKIENGVDLNAYQVALDQPQTLNDINKVKHPIIGYMGALAFSPKIDYDLMRYIAKNSPGWSIVIVGRYDENVNFLASVKQLSNVHFLGEKSLSSLPHYVNCFDVGIIPWKKSILSENSDPLKLYEYLAAGKPIVSTPVPSVSEMAKRYPALIKIADVYDEFIYKIKESLTENNEILQRKRIELAKQHTWDVKAEEMLSLIDKELKIGL